MTKKIYNDDPYLKTIEATVVKSQAEDKLFWHMLDQTILYPGGGGQAEDRGSLNGMPVLGVKKDGEQIWYAVKEQLTGTVKIELDWSYRFENMQQHSGQHVLSAVFHNLLNAETVSVHLGSAETLIELQCASLTGEQLREVENRANAIIREQCAVNVSRVEESQLKEYALRRPLKVEKFPARLVTIGGYDCTGCGGTHVRNTAEIGLIKITGVEKIRGRVRVIARIGQSAYIYFDETHQAAKAAAAKLSSKISDLPRKIDALEDERRLLSTTLKRVSASWLELLLQTVEVEDKLKYRFYENPDLTDDQARQFSARWVEQAGQVLFLRHGLSLQKFNLRLPDQLAANAGEWMHQFGAGIGLKGGGSSNFVQGMIVKHVFNREKLEKSLTEWIGSFI